MKKIWNGLPPWAKGAIVIFIIILLFLIIRNVNKWIARIRAKQQIADLETSAEATGEQPTYLPANYNSFANSLYYAMQSSWYNPFDWGTDETAINEIFNKMMNTRDVVELLKAFGTRDGYDLGQWLSGDGMTQSVNQILQSKSINYSF